MTQALVEDRAATVRPAPTARAPTRLSPRIWHTDWLVLRGMHTVIARMAKAQARPGETVIDFGCGDRPYAAIFTDLGCRYRGADLGGGADLTITPEGRLLAGGGEADGIASFQVLEHVRDLGMYFSEARRVLAPGGWMILSTHGNWLYHPHPEDHRRWTRQGLVGEIEAHGFEVEACEAVVGPLGWTTMLRLACLTFALRKLPAVGPPICAVLAAITNARAWIEDKVTPQWVTHDNACVYVTLCRPRAARAA